VTVIDEFEHRADDLVERSECDYLVLDLADVVSLDAAALGGLMRIAARSRRRARRLLIVWPRDDAALLLRLSGVGRQLPMVESRGLLAP
jgi:anti-anti-sigma factor